MLDKERRLQLELVAAIMEDLVSTEGYQAWRDKHITESMTLYAEVIDLAEFIAELEMDRPDDDWDLFVISETVATGIMQRKSYAEIMNSPLFDCPIPDDTDRSYGPQAHAFRRKP